jgi:hypothetical protein
LRLSLVYPETTVLALKSTLTYRSFCDETPFSAQTSSTVSAYAGDAATQTNSTPANERKQGVMKFSLDAPLLEIVGGHGRF